MTRINAGAFWRLMACIVTVATIASLPIAAEAHVKWFAPYDLTAAPRQPFAIWSNEFGQLALAAVLALWLGSIVETTRFGRSVLIGLDLLTQSFRPRIDVFLRSCLAAFFIALWSRGGIILTPELATNNASVEWLQAGIAAGMFWRPSMAFSGIGIVALYAYGVASYGPFHMLDYPIFLGFAAYCVLRGMRRDVVGTLPGTVVRWSIAITLMWASVEKWAYSEWTFPILDLHPAIALGFSHSFFMTASGMVEFVLAFALIWTPLVRRLSAIILGTTFISAIFEFGKIDAIGHLPIIAALAGIIVEPRSTGRYPRPVWLPVCFVLALIAFVAAYCAAHSWLMPAP